MFNNVHKAEHEEFVAGLVSEGEYDRQEAIQGAAYNNNWRDEWISSDRDVWYANPAYFGPEGPHPEDEYGVDYGHDEEFVEAYRAYVEQGEVFERVLAAIGAAANSARLDSLARHCVRRRKQGNVFFARYWDVIVAEGQEVRALVSEAESQGA